MQHEMMGGEGLPGPAARPRPLTIRTLLVLLIAAILLPLLALSLYLADRYASAERRVIEARRFDVVESITEILHRDVEKIAHTLRTVATSDSLRSSDLTAFRNQIAAAAPLASIDYVILSDQAGKPLLVFSADGGPAPAVSFRLSDIPAGQDLSVSGFLRGPDNEPEFTLSVPTICAAGARCVLSAVLLLKRYNGMFAEANVPPEWTAGLLDRNGVMLARSRDPEKFLGRTSRSETQVIVQESEKGGVYDGVNFEGVAASNIFRKSALTGWTTVIAIPKTVINAPLTRIFMLMAIASAVLIGLGLLLATILARRIAIALRRLSGAAVALVDGGAPQIENPGIRELSEVQRAFEYAASIAHEHRETQTRLRSHELFFRLLIDSAAEGIFSIDQSGTITICNAAFVRLAGATDESQVVGWPLLDIMQHTRADGTLFTNIDDPILSAARTGFNRHAEGEFFFRRDGNAFPVEYWVRPIYQDEQLQGVVCTMVDISARLRAEAMNAHLAAIVTSSADAIKSISLEGNVVSWNEGAERLFGYKASEIVGQSLSILIPESRRGELQEKISAVANGENFRRETVRRRKDGSLIDVHIEAAPIYDARGAIIGVSTIARDITQRKRIEGELRSREAQFRSVFNNSAVGMARSGLDGHWLMVNARMSEITGYSAAELLRRRAVDLTFTDDLYADEDQMRDLLDGKIPSFALDKRFIRKDGSTTWVGITVSLERDSAGQPLYFLHVVRDISAHREAEQHQFFLMRELSHRSKNLLAVIQAMARQTARVSYDIDTFLDRFSLRLQGLATSHDLLVHQNWKHVLLTDLVQQQLAPFVDMDSGRLVVGGPMVAVIPEAAQALGLALHELATNAAKHGSLSAAGGRVAVTWDFVTVDGQERLRVEWAESGGPRVKPPAGQGFGHVVITRMAGRSLDGHVEIDFAPAGLRWAISFPTSNLVLG
ncbi:MULTISPECIES: PAS domain S-box protein [unclassified Beijerinckia]|uniref:PAS domain S-box protein n=1 Tax=unclassified Beijerinckia TaxID=2638183 RepID=UPI001AEC83C6|nr:MULTISPECIES: PAS domain S-box protein [unclassified Beijerinckia]